MRTLTISTIALCALAAPALAQGMEEVVTIESPAGPFIGTLELPGGDPAPAVLLLHGFTGSRDELPTDAVPEGIFARTAERLAAAGYASLRIDFRGSGESTSDLTYADTTFDGQVADALAALSYLAGSPEVAGDDLFVIGWSQGGLVATATAGRSDLPDAVALWAAVADPMQTYGDLLGAEAMAAGLAAEDDAAITAALPWGADVTLKAGFFDGIESFDPRAEIASYSGPLLVAQGSLDTTVLPASADMLIGAHEGPETLWTAEMDHSFNAFVDDKTLEEMIAATIEFFDANAD
ncbi:alpha/beta hydrolase family protein [Sinisalibacter aestuarii]|uniref:Alpha/beta hydrolase n=1 Tax=Sinisalibacter aestuarii TaxID=2949426 RepID=A0ABQ5LU27_9RHOB|nr:alpha/beta fold hydrolase [Sinisalibacter aestuarii]GKY88484.1 alpha/beta hydrolase [Sinisalibacter aestuarii]